MSPWRAEKKLGEQGWLGPLYASIGDRCHREILGKKYLMGLSWRNAAVSISVNQREVAATAPRKITIAESGRSSITARRPFLFEIW
jgi:hypothetical protein